MEGQNQICWVCFPQRDGMEPLQGELAAARRRFFTDTKHSVSLDRDQSVKGFKGHVKGRLAKHRFYWKLRAEGTSGGEVVLEEAFGKKDGWTVVVRDMHGVIVSRSFFDKKHQWLRTEYYEPWDAGRARVSFAPGSESDTVMRRDWDAGKGHYRDTLLRCVPYLTGTAGQSVVDAQIGEPQLLLVLAEGEVCCCPKDEAEARLKAMKNVNSGTVVLMPAWEIKGGELVKGDGDDAGITFTSLEEYAKIEPREPGGSLPALTGETLPPPEGLGKKPAPPVSPAPERPLPPAAADFAPERMEPASALPFIEPHEARHMREPVNYEALIDEPVPPAPQPPAPAPAPMPVQVQEKPAGMEPEPLIPELDMAAPMKHLAPAPKPVKPEPVKPAPVVPEPEKPMPVMPVMPEPPKPAPKAPEPPKPAPAAEKPAPVQKEAGPREPEEDMSLETILAEAALYSKAPSLPEPSQETAVGKSIPDGYTGDIKDGKISGRGRTEQRSGLTSYEGDYVDGKRHGFGTYYYKDGNLCYAGAWKDDRRDGLGVSFRDSDHALHVATWKDGQPQGLVTLFDAQGNLRFSGRMENGKKEGAGVVINGGDGTVFVGQWAGGEATGLGSAFDRDGRLLYYGGWKDGKRHGHGTEFDLNGGVVFDGEFRDGKYYNGVLYQKV